MRKILLIDDSDVVREMLKALLSSSNFEILEACDGLEGIKEVYRSLPDLIISDIEMPRINGYQVCRIMKSDAQLKNIPIIMLTSMQEAASKYWGLETGADEYITKDRIEVQLLGKVNNLLTKFKKKTSRITFETREINDFDVFKKINEILDKHLFNESIISKINKIGITPSGIKNAIKEIFTIIRSISSFEIGGFALTREDNVSLYVNLNKDMNIKYIQYFEFKILNDLSNFLNKNLADSQIDIVVFDESKIDNGKTYSFNPATATSFPLYSKGKQIGILTLGKIDTAISEEEKRIVEKLLNQISLVIDSIQMYEKIKNLSIIDQLTQIYNKAEVMRHYNQLFEECREDKEDLTIFMLDIDKFKNVNDTYGHLTGDIVIKNIAHIIKSCIRSTDIPGRYGGEEFMVVFPATDIDTAATIGEKIREMVEAHEFTAINNVPFNITISIGAASLNDSVDVFSTMDLIQKSDDKLYIAKNTGRNKFVY